MIQKERKKSKEQKTEILAQIEILNQGTTFQTLSKEEILEYMLEVYVDATDEEKKALEIIIKSPLMIRKPSHCLTEILVNFDEKYTVDLYWENERYIFILDSTVKEKVIQHGKFRDYEILDENFLVDFMNREDREFGNNDSV